ncbi:MAG: molybdenum cofactor cytidylyltransferase [Pirellulaceae bacterium]|nr:MAG: molybdenum cofactor cytidylyltransferase [Pirellulaceae bacterium]
MTSPDSAPVAWAALVLCGGQSRRMGRPKAWLPFGSESMLQRVIGRLGQTERFDRIVVVKAPQQPLPPLPKYVHVVEDHIPGLGPLGGMAAGLAALAGTLPEPAAAYVTSCDVPLLVPAVVQRICEQLQHWAAVVPVEEQYPHPLAAAYRLDVLPVVQQLLDEGEHRPRRLFELVPTHYLPVEMFRELDPELDTFHNVNTPEEYQESLRRAGLA